MHTLPPGFRIDEYEIVRVLGAGGFGITYLAFDHLLNGPVALKEYFPETATRTDGPRVTVASPRTQERYDWGLDRFLNEARTIHGLRHSSIVRVHRYVERNGTAYIVMEYVEGASLASILESRGGCRPTSGDPGWTSSWTDWPMRTTMTTCTATSSRPTS